MPPSDNMRRVTTSLPTINATEPLHLLHTLLHLDMYKQVIIVFCISIVAFTLGYFLQVQDNVDGINDRDDLLDAIEKLEVEIQRSGVKTYHHDFEWFFAFDDSYVIVPISVASPYSYPIRDPSDYERWRVNFFDNGDIDNQTKFIHIKINPNENGFLLLQKGEWEYDTLYTESHNLDLADYIPLDESLKKHALDMKNHMQNLDD